MKVIGKSNPLSTIPFKTPPPVSDRKFNVSIPEPSQSNNKNMHYSPSIWCQLSLNSFQANQTFSCYLFSTISRYFVYWVFFSFYRGNKLCFRFPVTSISHFDRLRKKGNKGKSIDSICIYWLRTFNFESISTYLSIKYFPIICKYFPKWTSSVSTISSRGL